MSCLLWVVDSLATSERLGVFSKLTDRRCISLRASSRAQYLLPSALPPERECERQGARASSRERDGTDAGAEALEEKWSVNGGEITSLQVQAKVRGRSKRALWTAQEKWWLKTGGYSFPEESEQQRCGNGAAAASTGPHEQRARTKQTNERAFSKKMVCASSSLARWPSRSFSFMYACNESKPDCLRCTWTKPRGHLVRQHRVVSLHCQGLGYYISACARRGCFTRKCSTVGLRQPQLAPGNGGALPPSRD